MSLKLIHMTAQYLGRKTSATRIDFEASRLKYKRNITVTSTAISQFQIISYFNNIK